MHLSERVELARRGLIGSTVHFFDPYLNDPRAPRPAIVTGLGEATANLVNLSVLTDHERDIKEGRPPILTRANMLLLGPLDNVPPGVTAYARVVRHTDGETAWANLISAINGDEEGEHEEDTEEDEHAEEPARAPSKKKVGKRPASKKKVSKKAPSKKKVSKKAATKKKTSKKPVKREPPEAEGVTEADVIAMPQTEGPISDLLRQHEALMVEVKAFGELGFTVGASEDGSELNVRWAADPAGDDALTLQTRGDYFAVLAHGMDGEQNKVVWLAEQDREGLAECLRQIKRILPLIADAHEPYEEQYPMIQTVLEQHGAGLLELEDE
ncbi:MAG TPA: hypothetical protein VKA74_12060 [Myxococcota bacterium]|nr:hypothetical protein [Myxococcota bacterium]